MRDVADAANVSVSAVSLVTRANPVSQSRHVIASGKRLNSSGTQFRRLKMGVEPRSVC